MFEFARKHEIPVEQCGKLIVATSEEEIPRLMDLSGRAKTNGVRSKVISAAEAMEIEPNVNAIKALWVADTGIINYRQVSEKLATLASESGALLKLGCKVENVYEDRGQVIAEHGLGQETSDYLVNAAGLQSDRIAKLAGFEPEVRIIPFRGEYFELTPSSKDLVKGLVYPVPNPDMPFLGVHLTRMIEGTVHAGPNAVLALSREGYRKSQLSLRDLSSTVTYPGFIRFASRNLRTGFREMWRSAFKARFVNDVQKLVPAISSSDLVRAGAGVRAQAISATGELIDDFVIQQNRNQIHILNAPSPAATSSLEIAKYVIDLISSRE